jgi:ribonuclease P protein component
LRLPRAARLHQTAEFRRVRTEGRSWPGRYFTLAVLEGAERGPSRIGLITTRQVGGAVVRNRIRRRLREIVRQARPRLKSGCWIVLIARPAAARGRTDQMRDEWNRLAERAALWRPVR